MEPTLIIGAAAVNASLVALWWAVSSRRAAPVDLGSGGGASHDLRTILLRESASSRAVRPAIERLGARIGRLGPAERVAALADKLASAGLSTRWTAERLLAVKVLAALGLGLAFVLRAVGDPSAAAALVAVAAAGFGWYLPNGVVERRVEQRRLAVRVELSDTIDQLAVMVRAGLGIDGALARTARTTAGPLGEELTRVVQDMRVGVSRTHALGNMADRIDVPELRGFVTALAQAEALGVPVAHTLQIQAEELRVKRRQLAEEQAMKLPVKILFPMVTCMLPTLFIVLLGPATIRIMDQL